MRKKQKVIKIKKLGRNVKKVEGNKDKEVQVEMRKKQVIKKFKQN